MIDLSEIPDGETWELFGRDFLIALGFVVESGPDRGADRGRDMLAAEQLEGRLANYHFRWLVSCKHFAKSGKAVNEEVEQNILERAKSFNADGFLGLYSTIPTANLSARLEALKVAGDIRDYRLFDGRAVERYLLRIGYASLLMRYLPESYKRVRPLHVLDKEYSPLLCEECKKDLLVALFNEEYMGMIGFASSMNGTGIRDPIQRVYAACKGACDQAIDRRFRARDMLTTWQDVSDLAIPVYFLQYVFGIMRATRDGTHVFTDAAFVELQHILAALAQKVLRETTEQEKERLWDDLRIPTI